MKHRVEWVWLALCAGFLLLGLSAGYTPVVHAQQVANTPVAVAKLFDSAETADTDILGADITVPERLGNCAFRVMILVDTETELRLVIKSGETTKLGDFNEDATLKAGNLYTFTFSAFAESDGEDAMSYNFQLDDNANVDFLLVERVKAEVL